MKISSFDVIVANAIVDGINKSRFSDILGVDSEITESYNSLLTNIKSWDFNDPKSIHILDINHGINKFESLLKLKIHVGIDIIRYSMEILFEDEFKRRIHTIDNDAFTVLLKCDRINKIIKHYRRLASNRKDGGRL